MWMLRSKQLSADESDAKYAVKVEDTRNGDRHTFSSSNPYAGNQSLKAGNVSDIELSSTTMPSSVPTSNTQKSDKFDSKHHRGLDQYQNFHHIAAYGASNPFAGTAKLKSFRNTVVGRSTNDLEQSTAFFHGPSGTITTNRNPMAEQIGSS